MSVVVVALMLTVCFASISATEAADDSNVISSDDVVTLDVTKSFRENSSELAKLGITNYRDWTYDEEHECYVLTLDNVHFKTTANVGIMFTAPASVQNPTVAIKLVGVNSIASGAEMIVPTTVIKGYCAAGILASHLDSAGEQIDDFRVSFIGDGTIVVENDATGGKISGSAGLDIYGSLLVAQDATVIAHAGDIDITPTKAPTGVKEVNVYSVGVYVSKTIAVVSQHDGPASLIGIGGYVDLYLAKGCFEGKHDLYSEGMTAESYVIINSYVSGIADGVDYMVLEKLETTEAFELDAVSVGISTRDESIDEKGEMHAYISNSKVVGEGYYAEGRDYVESVGIELGDTDRIVIKDSILIGTGEVAESDRKDGNYGYASTEGITLYGIVDITSSFVRGVSGGQAIVSNDNSVKELYGIYASDDMTVRDSIVIARGQGLKDQEWSNGIAVFSEDKLGTVTERTLNVVDSELYLSGMSSAAFVGEINASVGYWAYTYDDGTKKTITIEDFENVKTASLLYKNDAIVVNSVLGVIDFDRTASNTAVIAPYTEFVPDGMRFAGYYDLEGNEVPIGSTVRVDQFNVYVATFEPIKEPSNDDNSWIVWVVVIIALVVIALMAAGLYVWKSRN